MAKVIKYILCSFIPNRSLGPVSQLINCPHFVVHRVVVQVAQQIDFHCDSFVIVVCLWGTANINGIDIR